MYKRQEYQFKKHFYLDIQGGGQYTLGEAKFKDLLLSLIHILFKDNVDSVYNEPQPLDNKAMTDLKNMLSSLPIPLCSLCR